MICSSLNRDCLIVRLLPGDGLYSNLEEVQGLRSDSQELAAGFGKLALQSAFLVNGGALVALPPLMQWLSDTGRSLVSGEAIWFLFGILCGALACLAAYSNFMAIAEINRARGSRRAIELNAQYEGKLAPDEKTPEYHAESRKIRNLGPVIRVTQVAAILFVLGSYFFFFFGVYGFIDLALRLAPTTSESVSIIAPVTPLDP